MNHALENLQARAWTAARRGDSPDPWAVTHERDSLGAAIYMQKYREVAATQRRCA